MSLLKDRIANNIRAFVRKSGYELTKTHRMHTLLMRQDTLLRSLAETITLPTGKGVAPAAEGIVFSKDRPLQLHLLLQSYAAMVKNPVPLHVLYAASSPAFEKAYTEVKTCFPQLNLTFIQETRFKASLLPLLESLRADKMFFLTDDDVFINELDMNQFTSMNPKEVVTNLVLSPQVTHCYTTQRSMPIPPIKAITGHKNLREFTWGSSYDMWNYPMMVDGTLFDTREMRIMSALTTYKAPNSFEGALMEFAHGFRQRKGYCFDKVILMNLPLNKVQTENTNVAGASDADSLLDTWNSGMMIDPSIYYGTDFTGFKTQEPLDQVEVKLIPRPKPRKAA